MMSGPFQAKSRGIGQGSGGRQDPGRLLLFVLVEVRWFVFSWVKPEKAHDWRRKLPQKGAVPFRVVNSREQNHNLLLWGDLPAQKREISIVSTVTTNDVSPHN